MSEVPTRPEGHDALLARLEDLAERALAGTSRGDAASGPGSAPHAILFVGPSAVGKYAAALWWARRFKCPDRAKCRPVCVTCKRAVAGSHPDVILVAPEGEKALGIDPVRELIRAMSLKGMSSGPRIAILRDAHRLTVEAQSALLKLLEEPPGTALLVLVTENPAALLPTVRSRCQQLRFGAVPEDTIVSILVGRGFAPDLAARAAALSLGSVGRALALTPEVIADRDDLIRAIEGVQAADPWETEQLVAALVERRKQGKAGLEEVLQWTLLRIEAASGAPPKAESPELEPIVAATDASHVETLLERAERVQWTLEALDRNANAKLAIRDLLLTLQERRAQPAT